MLTLKVYRAKFKPTMSNYDYIIAGAGASGLTLAYLLLGLKDSKRSILIIDKDSKAANDRTWCFWEKEENLFEHLVYHHWSKATVKGNSYNETFKIAPYRYKMIRSIDFYEDLIPQIKADSRVTWKNARIEAVKPDGKVQTSVGTFKGEVIFNSTINYQELQFEEANNILQHFKGWIINTKNPHFEPDKVTYMDFSIDQEGDCRFGYVLPFTDKKALVEYTVFNKEIIDDRTYDQRLNDYIKKLGVEDFKNLEEEKGVIPMTDFHFKIKESAHLYNIGILGGFAKASTGYSFLRAQNILKKMVQNIADGKAIDHALPHQKGRFKKYDATLLDVLANGKYTGEEIFTSLFRKNGAQAVFKFLDEETSLAEELKIMSSTPILDFGISFIKQLTK